MHVPLAAGELVSQYRIIEKIGAGGMGEVYLAEDTRLKRKVALKFLPSHLVANEEIKARFLREAQAVAKLNHPNIVTIYDVSEFNGRPFFAMEHVEGHLLHHFAHEKPLPLDTVIDYAVQVCQGIGEAHRAGVVHRDIKATNIIVDTKGRARLLDFGLAAVAGDDKLTKTGSTLGTVSYMSPEQVSGRDIDQRSDLFLLVSFCMNCLQDGRPSAATARGRPCGQSCRIYQSRSRGTNRTSLQGFSRLSTSYLRKIVRCGIRRPKISLLI